MRSWCPGPTFRRLIPLVALLAALLPLTPPALGPAAARAGSPAAASDTITNLLSDGDFEAGSLASWNVNSGTMAVSNSPVHTGSFAARTTGGYLTQSFPVTPGTTYKVTFWVYLANVSGGTWGGPRVWTSDPLPSGWSDDGGTDWLQNPVQPGTWTEMAYSFTPTQIINILNVGNYGDRTVDVSFDDVQVFVKPATNTPPTIAMTASTTAVSSLKTSVAFTSTGSDMDGAISEYFWDFGDGGKSNLANPTYSYAGNGTYSVTLNVYDDDGGRASARTTISVADPTYPTLSVTTPSSSPFTSSAPTLNFGGTASGGSGAAISGVTWSTDRGKSGTATGTGAWSFTLDLTGQGGRNRVLIDAIDANGNVARQDVLVNYLPSSPVSIVGGAAGVTPNGSSVAEYDKFEATFSLQNSVASNPSFPYDTNVADGMVPGVGISVTGIFTSPTGKTFAQPGFLYQPYDRNVSTQQLIASGAPVWKLRFAPQELGTWTYQISVADGSGTTVLQDPSLTFTAVAPTNPQNHGFLLDSPTDPRYFAFSDGTPFIGVGPGATIGDSFSTDQSVAQVGTGSANFSRTWMSGQNVAGSAWVPWAGALPYDGNVPDPSLTTSQAYGDGQFSLDLSVGGNACAFYGWEGVNASLVPNTTYRILLRLKTVGVTGPGGFTFRPAESWPNGCGGFAGQSVVVPYQTGTEDWHTVAVDWNSGSNAHLGYALLTLENATAGQVYVDEVSIRQDLGNGQLGPEVLPRSNFNVQNYFSQEPSWNWDYGLDRFAQHGMYEKIVVEEKQDYAYNHISPYGYGYAGGGQMENATGAALRYQQYFWQYLIARYGYSRAIQSFEYANEQAPGNLYMAEQLASYVNQNDPQRHLADTSDWSGITAGNAYEWQDPQYPDIGYADAHAYVNNGSFTQPTTSWLGTTDPFTGGSIVLDSAQFTSAHSLDQYNKNAAGKKPMVIGEAGIIYNQTIAGQSDTDTKGVWLHQFLWPQMNAGGAYFIYWFNTTIQSNNLYPLFTTYRQFMEGSPSDPVNTRIPLTNGRYGNLPLTLASGVLGWGQIDPTNGGAHFWMYDTGYTWTNPSGGSPLGGKSVSFSGLPANTYTIQWWDTWTGAITTQTIDVGGGTVNLTVPAGFSEKDVAVKIFPQDGYTPAPGIPPTVGSFPYLASLDIWK